MCSNPQTKELRWIVRRGAFGGAGHVGPDCRDGGAFVCCHGGAFHDGRRGSLLFLRLFGELDHDALQNEGSRVKQDGMITRFGLFFGGLVTAIAGVIAKQFGAAVGGLFLAFPAIFPASATLIEETREAKEGKKGLHGAPRGREAASMDAGGAAMGSIGLLLFALSCLALHLEPQSLGGTEDCHARWARSFCDDVDDSKNESSLRDASPAAADSKFSSLMALPLPRSVCRLPEASPDGRYCGWPDSVSGPSYGKSNPP
jgi:hypothetical protein